MIGFPSGLRRIRVVPDGGALIRPSALAMPPTPCFVLFAMRLIRTCVRGMCLLAAPRYLIRDRDQFYGECVRNHLKDTNITQVLTAP